MASMRRVRKDFRKEVYRLISAGDGSIDKLVEVAGRFFGRDVGYEVLIKTFLQSEVSNAVTCLRSEGHIETVGKRWKLTEELRPEDVDVISTRRWKRLRGELKSEARLAHDHGRISDATAAGQMLSLVSSMLASQESAEEAVRQEAEVVQS